MPRKRRKKEYHQINVKRDLWLRLKRYATKTGALPSGAAQVMLTRRLDELEAEREG